MRYLKLTIAYDGTAYSGWQRQPNQATVQGAIEAAWAEVTSEVTQITGSSRTDAGVHALGQVASVATACSLEPAVVARALNAKLPLDVAVVRVDEEVDGFDAIRETVSKRYRYQVHNSRHRLVFGREYWWQIPQLLDVEAMHRAGQALVGRHDFASFQSAGSTRESTVRTIHELAVTTVGEGQGRGGAEIRECGGGAAGREHAVGDQDARSDRDQSEPIGLGVGAPAFPAAGAGVTIEVEGDGFLYNMVRAIAGTLVEVGRGARPESWVNEVLVARDRKVAGPTAPALGLFLVRVNYSDANRPECQGKSM